MAQGIGATGEDWSSVAFIDVHDMRGINERYGYEIGDRVIARVLGLLTDALPPSAAIHRRGDQFWVLCRFEPERLERRLALINDHLAAAEIAPTTIAAMVAPWPPEVPGEGRRRRGVVPLPVDGLGRDPLSGLLDRRSLLTVIGEHPHAWGALAFIDFDAFKRVNDEFGHAVGDALLQAFARILLASVPPDCAVARTGGDEFAVLSVRSPGELVARLEAAADELAQIGGLGATFSAGVKRIGPAGVSERDLADADAAMYKAKRDGRRRIVVHGPETEEFAADRRDLLDRLARMHETIRRLRTESLTDPLTGLGNRRALDRREQVAEARRASGACWGVLFVDVDRFGAFNKMHGDAAGDAALVDVATTLRSTLRSTDLVQELALEPEVYRKGGEEFVALLPVRDLAAALLVAERMRAAVEALAIEHGAGCAHVTVSIGVAVTDDATTVERAREIAASRAVWLKNHARRNDVLGHDPTDGDEDVPSDEDGDGGAAS